MKYIQLFFTRLIILTGGFSTVQMDALETDGKSPSLEDIIAAYEKANGGIEVIENIR